MYCLETSMSKLTQGLSQTNSQLSQLAQGQANLQTTLQAFIQAMTPSPNDPKGSASGSNGNDSSSSNGSPVSSPSSKIPPQELPLSLPEITILNPADQNINFGGGICTADLEALILPDGTNYVYMAAWYNGIQSSILSVIHYSSQGNFLKAFWSDLIEKNEGRICYLVLFACFFLSPCWDLALANIYWRLPLRHI